MATLTMYRGDDKSWDVTIAGSSGAVMDLTGCTVWFTAKRARRNADADAVVSCYWTQSAESGLSRTDPDTGVVSPLVSGVLYLSIPSATSRTLTPFSYEYDVQLKDANGRYTTVTDGRLQVTEDVTQRITTP